VPRITARPILLRYEETRTSRKLEANLTDNAVENLAGPINAIMAAGMLGGQRTRRMPMADIIDTDEPLVIQHETIHEAEIISRPIPAQAPVKALESPTPPSGDDRLRALFRQKDGHLYLYETRLKGTSRLESARRLIYLRLLYAQQIEQHGEVSREELLALVKNAGWFDINNTVIARWRPCGSRREWCC